MPTILKVLIPSVALVALLCSCTGEDEAQSDLARKTNEVIAAAGDVAREGAEKLSEVLSTRLDDMSAQMEDVKAKIAEQSSEAKAELTRQWDSLAGRREELKAKLASASEEAGDALVEQLDQLEGALRELEAKLK